MALWKKDQLIALEAGNWLLATINSTFPDLPQISFLTGYQIFMQFWAKLKEHMPKNSGHERTHTDSYHLHRERNRERQ